MSDVFRRYFEVTDPCVVEGARAIMRRKAALTEAFDALATEMGFETAAVQNNVHLGFRLVGFARPKGEVGREWRELRERMRSGDVVYVPRRSVKAGKLNDGRLAKAGRLRENRELLALVGLADFPDAIGATSSGLAMYSAGAALADGDDPALLVTLPFAKVDADVPESLATATELTEHQFRAREESRHTTESATP